MMMRLGWPPRSAVKATLSLWTFGFLLVAALTAVQGRGTLLVQLLIQGGFWVLAIALAMGLHACFRNTQSSPALLRWLLLALSCAVAGAVQTSADILLMDWLARTFFPDWRSWTVIDVPRAASVWILYTWTFGLNVALFTMLSAFEEARRHAARAAAAEAAVKSAQLALLRLQLNPHFLFNTLNTISGLMLEGDIANADCMVTRLSEFLRASLDIDPNAHTLLGDEFNSLDAYLQIEALRFEGRLDIRYECPEPLRAAKVPSFILQPLVENAVKYAVAPSLREIQIVVAAREAAGDLILTVTDDGGQFAQPPRQGGGVGLKNVQARLTATYGDRGRLTTQHLSSGFHAELRFPLEREALPEPL